MKGRKRLYGKLMRISDIYEGKVLGDKEDAVYIYKEKPVGIVRLFGTVVNRYDNPETSDRKFCFLTIDDGSQTIRLKIWSFPIPQDDGSTYDAYDMMEGIEVGDIVDVFGRVRKYNDEIFVIPNSISADKDIEWEIYRRTKLIEKDLKEVDLLPEPKNPVESLELKTEEEPEIEEEKEIDLDVDAKDLILETFSPDKSENTIEKIVQRTGFSKIEVQNVIKELQVQSLILEPNPGQYLLIEDTNF